MNKFERNAITLLDQIVSTKSGKRTETLLYPKSDDLYLGWMYVVGRHFRDAFDIKYTTKRKNKKEIKVWTQGSSFSVKEGYLFKMVNRPDWMLQVIGATPATPAGNNKERDKGSVTYQHIKGNTREKKLYTVSQDEFIRTIIAGERPLHVVSFEKVCNNDFNLCPDIAVYKAHVRLSEINEQAVEMINVVSDTSWLNELDVIDRLSFEARAQKTIEKLVIDIFQKVNNQATEEFGEYLISHTASRILATHLNHTTIPLAEILKEKVTGNPGFDFHTESHTGYVAFGEAKYSGKKNPYQDALGQIVDFITKQKDLMELRTLKPFVSDLAISNAANNAKAYIAAFSVNAQSPDTIFGNALASSFTKQLSPQKELYLIGVEIDA
ncbi:hypothetical protein [Halodesulfovibrio aestuarii]|uniref:hypothetical protein n=1 Tax=Halodesulfovibrio aestuarii TaxID=126333 RepID=UPI003D324E65